MAVVCQAVVCLAWSQAVVWHVVVMVCVRLEFPLQQAVDLAWTAQQQCSGDLTWAAKQQRSGDLAWAALQQQQQLPGDLAWAALQQQLPGVLAWAALQEQQLPGVLARKVDGSKTALHAVS
ncbi:hypothetical protein CRENBAI_000018 [Crenichthys baileyi]|uniref:Uncharacterized protein n=1 Tax=Crenichthys baileyi TaxID=28760 RepID=A0AAV9SS89_9TELE